MDYSIKKLTSLVRLNQKGGSVYYFQKSGTECHFLKLGCVESSLAKTRGCQFNLFLNFFNMSGTIPLPNSSSGITNEGFKGYQIPSNPPPFYFKKKKKKKKKKNSKIRFIKPPTSPSSPFKHSINVVRL